MLKNMLDNYSVFFEGLPEPIFYRTFYPMGSKNCPESNELWRMFNYSRGLKHDKDPEYRYYNEFHELYVGDLRNLFNTLMNDFPQRRRGVVVIPSSNSNVINRATILVKEVLKKNPRPFDDLTGLLQRVKDRDSSHQGGSRSFSSNYDTLASLPKTICNFDLIVVIDDIVTTGSSFRVANHVIRESWFGGEIVNFAFSKTCPSEGVVLCQQREARKNSAPRLQNDKPVPAAAPLEGIIFDLDQTLLDDPIRDIAYEGEVWRSNPKRLPSIPYKLHEGIEEIMHLHMPFAIVSNRPDCALKNIIGDDTIYGSIYIESEHGRDGSPQAITYPENVFSFPEKVEDDESDYRTKFYKPSPRGVNNAVEYLQTSSFAGRNDARIVGIGNTLEDIVAYEAAGIESVLALWGIPDSIKDYAMINWDADYTFNDVDSFASWLKKSASFFDRAMRLKESDPETACHLFELAIQNEDNIDASSFYYALLVSEKDPAKAIALYEKAISAGDNRYATNNLACLIETENPERAIELYERAIAAGNELYATYNLARLIEKDNPDEAKALYRRAIEAGDKRDATNNLGVLLETCNQEEAQELYKMAIAAGNELNATYNLANLVKKVEPEFAISLLERAITAGNEKHATFKLGALIHHEDPERAAELYERAIEAGNERDATNNLATLIQADDPERAIELYERAIAAGCEKTATFNLAVLIHHEDPERAAELYERAIEAGNERDATNNLATLIQADDPERAIELYERAIAAGDNRCATCNLAHMLTEDDPDRARELYELSLNHNEVEAVIGLSFLLRKSDEPYALNLAKYVLKLEDILKNEALNSFLNTLNALDERTAKEARHYLKTVGLIGTE